MRVTIASRRSDLARIQAYQVGEALRAAHPHIELNYSFHESLGDKNLSDPLWKMPEKGVFTQDFREGLLRGDFDLVVHSWKDLAIEEDPETQIVATLPRADQRDLVLVRKDRWPAVAASGLLKILTSSPRRAHNLDSFLREALPAEIKQIDFVNVRGNVPTRVRKLFAEEVDGLVVAKAALDRLLEAPQEEFADTRKDLREALAECFWMVMPLRENPSAPAQGALGIEISRQRDDVRALLAPINCAETFSAVEREREILRSFGGGCHQRIGASVLRRPFGEITFLRGISDSGQVLDSYSLATAIPRPPRVERAAMWPPTGFSGAWFRREKLPANRMNSHNAIWVAKAFAYPAEWPVQKDQIVWASGVETWTRLAKLGVWINGCAESLGERESPRIETLVAAPLHWLKLTHNRGYTDGSMEILATYRLPPADEPLHLEGKRYFFWRSGSAFERALSLNPWLKEMVHFCGPGNTQRILQQHGIQPHVFLDEQQWAREMTLYADRDFRDTRTT